MTDKTAIPAGSTILVTGCNSFVGSHIANQFLQHNFNIRGAVRDIEKSRWLETYCSTKYGPDRFELVCVPDMTTDGAFVDAVKGVSAVVHAACITNMSPDPSKVIPQSIAGATNALKAAYGEASVKRFVFTSSSSAATPSMPDQFDEAGTFDEHSWNDVVGERAWAPPPYEPSRGPVVYMAGNMLAEKAIWQLYAERKQEDSSLVVNSVLPGMNLGKVLDPVNQGFPTTTGIIKLLWMGIPLPPTLHYPQYYIDVEDDGLLHVAATVFSDVRGERVFGFAQPVNWDRVLEILRQQNPSHKFPENFAPARYPHTIEARQLERAEALLRRMGKTGWTSLENSLLANTETLRGDGGA